MAATLPSTTSYQGNRVGDNAIAILGSVHGDINIPDNSSREPCLRALGASDPRTEKDRIEMNKDKLLKECYSWILHNSDFRRWRDSEQSRLLWIKGDPGKGKTMMMIALAEELSRQAKAESSTSISGVLMKMARQLVTKRMPCLVSYFFCQSTDSRLNSATSVLKGLIYLLVAQEEGMIRHIRKKYEDGGNLFEGPTAVYTLRLILMDILNDSALPRTYLLIDALDECNEGLQQLLDTITDERFAMKSKVKWLVSSRNRPEIAERLRPDDARMKVSLELNPEHVTMAVNAFIDSKVQELALRKQYDPALKEEVRRTLSERSEATFLWVALACKRLEKEPASEAQSLLEELPAGLYPLYDRMIDQILREPDIRAGHCKQILRSAAVAYRPLRLQELVATTELPDKILDNVRYLSDLVEQCGSFLTIRNEIIFFIHQSAKDYVTNRNGREVLCLDQAEEHGKTALQTLNILSKALKRDICGLKNPGTLASELREAAVEDALLRIEYACCYWVFHLSDQLKDPSYAKFSVELLSDGGTVHKFLQAHLLHWIEALSLLRRLPEGVAAIQRLLSIVQGAAQSAQLFAFVRDAYQFVRTSRTGIKLAPLQVYSSALIFAPKSSIVRKQFSDHIPDYFCKLPVVDESWSSLLQTLEGHSDCVNAVAFSPDGKVLASASRDATVKLWDASTGAVLQTFTGHLSRVKAVAFSPDGKVLASASGDKTVKLWDVSTGAALQAFKGHLDWVNTVAFSPDGKMLASASDDKTIKLWDVNTGATLQTFKGHLNWVTAVAFSSDGKMLMSASNDEIVKLWNASTGAALQTFEGRLDRVTAVAFSPDGKVLASASNDGTIKLWDVSTGAVLQAFESCSDWINAVTFSPDGKVLTSASDDGTIKLWDASTGAALQTFEGHLSQVKAVAFSPNGEVLTSASDDGTIKLWNASTKAALQTFTRHLSQVNAVAFSPDGKMLASVSGNGTIKLWDTSMGTTLQMLESYSSRVSAVVFSPNGKVLTSASNDGTIKLWDVSTGATLQTFKGHLSWVTAVAFSPDGKVLMSASNDNTVKLWSAHTGAALQTFKGHSYWANAVTFSPDGKVLASASDNEMVKLWDVSTGTALQTFKGHLNWVKAVAFSPNGKLLASASDDEMVKLWDVSTGAALQTFKGHLDWVNAVAFSPDGKVLASASGDKTVKLWDTNTGAALQTLEIDIVVRTLSFSDDGTILETNRGMLRTSLPPSGVLSRRHLSQGIFVGEQWVTRGMEKVLWLPSEYRRCAAVHRSVVALGHTSGRVSIFEFA